MGEARQKIKAGKPPPSAVPGAHLGESTWWV